MKELLTLLEKYLPKETAEKLCEVMDENVPILVDGIQGPTGKTTLCRKLKELGYNAQELWKSKEKNEYDNIFKIVIYLNKILI